MYSSLKPSFAALDMPLTMPASNSTMIGAMTLMKADIQTKMNDVKLLLNNPLDVPITLISLTSTVSKDGNTVASTDASAITSPVTIPANTANFPLTIKSKVANMQQALKLLGGNNGGVDVSSSITVKIGEFQVDLTDMNMSGVSLKLDPNFSVGGLGALGGIASSIARNGGGGGILGGLGGARAGRNTGGATPPGA
jgi:hypothetical protein